MRKTEQEKGLHDLTRGPASSKTKELVVQFFLFTCVP